MAAFGYENIRGLYVAMRDAFGMRSVKTLRNFDGHFEQKFERHRLGSHSVLQRHPVQEFHRDERLALVLPDFVDRADVGMIQRRSGTRLTTETFERLSVTGYVIGKKFQCDEAPQFGVFGLVDNSHATAAKLFEDAVM